MANFTKGPWIAERQKSFSYAIHTNYVHDRGHDCNVVREVRCEANAFLIAAAPELFEALEALLDVVPFATDSNQREIHLRAEAAIRKAKGEPEVSRGH